MNPLPSLPFPVEASAEVRDALAAGCAVVALESTVLSFGLPAPRNLETGRLLESVVRAEGAVPATVGVVGGVVKVGLSAAEIVFFAEGRGIAKCSRRDFPVLCGLGRHGATTVSGTMAAAAALGVRFFATGGTGGVHRGGEHSWDVSADLREFERSAVCVISAGVKSILDAARTLEYLETCGIPVVGYRTRQFPLFYSHDSGCAVPHSVETEADAARVAQAAFALGTGMLLANPIPAEAEIPALEAEACVLAACAEAERAGVTGAALTPRLLSAMARESGGRTLDANVALLEANARLAARVAVRHAELFRPAGTK